jgi:hypothetical protein
MGWQRSERDKCRDDGRGRHMLIRSAQGDFNRRLHYALIFRHSNNPPTVFKKKCGGSDKVSR